MADIPYVYVLIRQDLPLEHQITQACHAALEVGFDHARPKDHPVHLITLGVPDQQQLEKYAEALEDQGHPYHLFFEPDENRGHTALATSPIRGSHRNLFRGLALWNQAGLPTPGGT